MPGGQHQRHQIRAVEASILRCFGRRGDLAGPQPVEVGDVVDHDGKIVRVGEQVLLEPCGERRELLVEFAELLLVVVAECGSRLGELDVVALDQVRRLVVESEVVELVVQGLDTPVQLWAEPDRVGMGRQQRRDLLLEFVGEVVTIRRALVEEDFGDPGEQLSRLLKVDEVLEARHVAAAGDVLHLAQLLGHALDERGAEVLIPYLCERRQAEGEGAGGEEGVLVGHSYSLSE